MIQVDGPPDRASAPNTLSILSLIASGLALGSFLLARTPGFGQDASVLLVRLPVLLAPLGLILGVVAYRRRERWAFLALLLPAAEIAFGILVFVALVVAFA